LAVISLRSPSSAPAGYRFPREVIAIAVRWYLRYGYIRKDQPSDHAAQRPNGLAADMTA
jgi:hypothetical protein